MSNQQKELPESVEQLRTVFREKLSGITFPDVSLEVIDQLVTHVVAGKEELEEAEKKVETAQEALAAAHEELSQKCMKALAYAKVYAEGQDGLLEVLSGIQFGKATRSSRKSTGEKTRKSHPRVKKDPPPAEVEGDEV